MSSQSSASTFDRDELLQLAVAAAGPINPNDIASWETNVKLAVPALLRIMEDWDATMDAALENVPDKFIKGRITRCEEFKTQNGGFTKGRIHFEALSGDVVGKPESIDTNILNSPEAKSVWAQANSLVGREVLLGKKVMPHPKDPQKKVRAVVAIKALNSQGAEGNNAPSTQTGQVQQPQAAPSAPAGDDVLGLTFPSTQELAKAALEHFGMDRQQCIDIVNQLAADGKVGHQKNRPPHELTTIWNAVVAAGRSAMANG